MLLAALLAVNRQDSIEGLIRQLFAKSDRKISIISDAAKVKNLKEHLKALGESGTDIAFIRLSPAHMNNNLYSGIFFDAVLYDNMAGELLSTKPLSKHLHPKTVIVSNGDDAQIPDFVFGIKACVITYGLGQKCSVTPSCIDADANLRFNACIQRGIQALDGKELEAGETAMSVAGSSHNIYDALAAAVLLLILT